MNNTLRTIGRNLRAIRRIPQVVAVFSIVFLGAFLQGLTPLKTTKPLCKLIAKAIGLKVVFNGAANIPKDVPFIAVLGPHRANKDFIAGGMTLPALFAGKSEIATWPIIGPMTRWVSYIALPRKSEFNDQCRGEFAKTTNKGESIQYYPEATTTAGEEVCLFYKALVEHAYGAPALDKNGQPVPVKEFVVLPVALRVVAIGDEDAAGSAEWRKRYSLPGSSIVTELWETMKDKSQTIEITVLPALNPKDFPDAGTLMNQAAQNIVDIINPGVVQQPFRKAFIKKKSEVPVAA